MSAGEPMDVDAPEKYTYKEITARDGRKGGSIVIEDFHSRMKLGRKTGKSTCGKA